MCGIAGILMMNHQAVALASALVHMSWAMRSRGPDGEGYTLLSPDGKLIDCFGDSTLMSSRSGKRELSLTNDMPCSMGMAHRRLAIIDLSPDGHQPMQDDSNRYRIVFNGEIYNYQELRSELIGNGVRFKSQSDTEVVLQAFIKWGAKCLDRFNGDFAIAIWDNQQRSLFCARDRIGIKPLYYCLNTSSFIFGSDIKTILASGLVPATPDSVGLPLAMTFGIAPRPKTAFENIYALEQGHWMTIDAYGACHKEQYWRIPTGIRNPKMRAEAAVELAEHHIKKSIQRRLVADVPVSTFMSGGVDSTLVTSIASDLSPGITAFTLGFDSSLGELNEIEEAVDTAQMCDVNHIIETVTPESCLNNIDTWVDGYEEPFYSLAANHVMSSVAKRHNHKVVLNGLGGDEIFAGYDRFGRISQWKALKKLSFVSSLITGSSRKFQRISNVMDSKTACDFHTSVFRNLFDGDIRCIFSDSFLSSEPFIAKDITHELYASKTKFQDPIDALVYMDLMNYVGNHHVHRVDQFLMMNSIEGRFPLLDHELIEAAATIPSHILMKNGVKKWVLRQIARGRISPKCLAMKKKGFSLPLAQWMQGPLKNMIESSLDALEQRPGINPQGIQALRKRYDQNKFNDSGLWHLVNLELWFQRFIDSDPVKVFGRP